MPIGNLWHRRKESEEFLHRVRQSDVEETQDQIIRRMASILLDVQSEIDTLRTLLSAIKSDIQRGG
jgi:hypothetical protein